MGKGEVKVKKMNGSKFKRLKSVADDLKSVDPNYRMTIDEHNSIVEVIHKTDIFTVHCLCQISF